MDVQIRPMSPDDVVPVAALVADCNRFLALRKGFSARQVRRLLAERCSEAWVRDTTAAGGTYLAVSGGAVVGLVGIEGHDLAELWVAPRWHRRGVGARLFAKVEGILRERGHSRLTVRTTGYAIPFYEAMGARVVGEKACDRGPLEGWPLTYLEKDLD